jgi:hypothetical protein
MGFILWEVKLPLAPQTILIKWMAACSLGGQGSITGSHVFHHQFQNGLASQRIVDNLLYQIF